METGSDINSKMNPQNQVAAVEQRLINKVIGVTSSSGGVGRSFISGMLAIELARNGNRVGILDANFTGASIPMLFGISGPLSMGNYSFVPLQSNRGIRIISPNLLVNDEKNSVIWKEALAGKVIEELYREVEWGSLDYLIIDLPAATSEITISILQVIPFDGVIFVNQPQDISTRLNAWGIRTLSKMGINIIGIVENKTHQLNLESDHQSSRDVTTSTDSLVSRFGIPILARIPYISEISFLCDKGKIEEITLAEGYAFHQSFVSALLELELKAQEAAANAIAEQEETVLAATQEGPIQAESSQIRSHSGQYFSDTVMHLVRNKYNVGTMEKPDAQGLFTGQCGDRMQMDLKIVKGRIMDAKFTADGCGATFACGSMLTRMACTKTLEEAQKIQPDELITALDGLPDDHLHCAELAVMTLREALIDAIEGHENRGKY